MIVLVINRLGVRYQYCRTSGALLLLLSSWQWEASSGLRLIAGPDCLLLAVLLLEAIVSQSSLDGILCQHWEEKRNKKVE